MDDNSKALEARRPMVMKALDVTYLPEIPTEKLTSAACHKFPLENLLALGVAFEPLNAAVQAVIGGASGMSGIYYVNTKGMEMFRSGTAFIGSLKAGSGAVGGGQALMNPLMCDPTMLFMAAALMTIEKKLDEIYELQQDILEYLKAQEKAKIRGDINVLTDVLNNYKFNWNNEKYKTNKHVLVQDIRKDAEQSLLLCRSQIERQLSKKEPLHSDEEVGKRLRSLQAHFNDYQMALYAYSFASFLEVLLLENFDSAYLSSMTKSIDEYAYLYRTLYTSCYDQLEGYSQTSVQSYLAKGLAGHTRGVGETIGKIPVISRGSVDETLMAAGRKLGSMNTWKTRMTMNRFIDSAASNGTSFAENIRTLDRVFNQTSGILLDADNIYYLEE